MPVVAQALAVGALVADELATADDLAAMDAEVVAIVKAAVEFAEASPHPEVSSLFDYTYATPVPNDLRRLPAEPLFPKEA